jgi:signal transduction histidine kinase/CheY-like chemotaxis protein
MSSCDETLAAYRRTRDAVLRELPLRVSLAWTVVIVLLSFAPPIDAAAWAAMMSALFVLEAALYRRFFQIPRARVGPGAKARFAAVSFACALVWCWPVAVFIADGAPAAAFAAAAFLSGTLINLVIHNSASALIFASAALPSFVAFLVFGAAMSVATGSAPPLLAAVIYVSAILAAYGAKTRIERRLRAALAEAEAARGAAERASAAKSNFLAKVTHELRTPLNGVIGLAAALGESEPSDEKRRQIAAIGECGEALLDMIDKTLDHANLAAAPLRLETAPADLRAIAGTAIARWRAAAAEKGVALSLDLAEAREPFVLVDAERLGRALGHLVSNAVKFTDAGAILVKLRAARAGRGVAVAIEVSDTGCGVAPQDAERIFLPFEQADNSTTRAHGGVGLGLAVARALAETMGGALTLRPATGVGATFRFAFAAPAAQAPESDSESDSESASESASASACAPPAPDRIAAAGPRILLVEDNPVNRQVVRAMLAPLGAEIVEAENGAAALERLAERGFDVVLMDIQMPVMDGLSATRAIRASGAPYSGVPVVAVTAASSEADRAGCFAAGVDDFLAKPVRLEALSRLVERYAPAKAA